MTEKDIEELKKEYKQLKRDLAKAIFSLVLALVGLSMIFIFAGWKVGVAMLILEWGNNIARDGLYQKKHP